MESTSFFLLAPRPDVVVTPPCRSAENFSKTGVSRRDSSRSPPTSRCCSRLSWAGVPEAREGREGTQGQRHSTRRARSRRKTTDLPRLRAGGTDASEGRALISSCPFAHQRRPSRRREDRNVRGGSRGERCCGGGPCGRRTEERLEERERQLELVGQTSEERKHATKRNASSERIGRT